MRAGPLRLWGCDLSIKNYRYHSASTKAAVETAQHFSVTHSVETNIALFWSYLRFQLLSISILHFMGTLAIESYTVAGSNIFNVNLKHIILSAI